MALHFLCRELTCYEIFCWDNNRKEMGQWFIDIFTHFEIDWRGKIKASSVYTPNKTEWRLDIKYLLLQFIQSKSGQIYLSRRRQEGRVQPNGFGKFTPLHLFSVLPIIPFIRDIWILWAGRHRSAFLLWNIVADKGELINQIKWVFKRMERRGKN